MTKLSVNINKLATLRNSRGENNPDIVKSAIDCERFGAEGITVHPRPDERHITKNDVYALKEVVNTELNIEGYPDERFLDIIKEIKPTQATLVPDGPDVLTSNAGWNTLKNENFLRKVVNEIQSVGTRVSIFVDPDLKMVDGAQILGADRVELYTEPYANMYSENRDMAIKPYVSAAKHAQKLNIEVNAGHDLNQDNLAYFKKCIPFTAEVSIGHALICDALYLGLNNTIQHYLKLLENE